VFGLGHSTLWWARRASEVVAIEDYPEWYEHIRTVTPPNVTLHLTSHATLPPDEVLTRRAPYDVIAIDGVHRYNAALIAPSLLAEGGCVIFDNSEGYWGDSQNLSRPAIESLRKAGFQRVDFYGWCPGGVRPSCTSIFFKDGCFLFAGESGPEPLLT
jgi:hypothetical protein